MKIQATTFGQPADTGGVSSDAFAVRQVGETFIAALADGAGKAVGAREAAERAVRVLVDNYCARPAAWEPQKALREFARTLNNSLFQESLARYGQPELVSTLVVAVIEGGRLYGINIGDSRVYLLSGHTLTQLSLDHAAANGDRTMLTRALGLCDEVEPHSFECELAANDLVLLCSDGITSTLNDAAILATLERGGSARTLVADAVEQATPETRDDASAVVLRIAEPGHLRLKARRDLPIRSGLHRGENVDGYELVRPFAHSASAWLAEKDGVRWTLKFAPAEASENEAILTAFIREAWNAGRVSGDDAFVRAFTPPHATALYYVQEFIDAPSLKTVLRNRHLSVDEAVALGQFLAAAAQRLLRFDLVHGDIKPENILVLPDYAGVQFKLIDLGSAAEIFSVTSRAGTASYLSPERFLGAPVSERTEVFAIGVTLYEALIGAFPFGEIERFQTPVFSPPKPPSRRNPNLPLWLDAVLLRALSIEPQSRYQHFSELSFDLANPERVEPFHSANAPLLERLSPRFYRVGFWLLLGITLALLVSLLSRK